MLRNSEGMSESGGSETRAERAERAVKTWAEGERLEKGSGERGRQSRERADKGYGEDRAAKADKPKAPPAKSKKQLALEEQARVKAAEQAKLESEANKYLELAKLSPEQQAYMAQLQKQGQTGVELSADQQALAQQLKERSEGKGLQADAMTARAQERAARQQMAAAWARGYDPGAQRAAQRQISEQTTDIAGQGAQAAAQEKAQALAQYGAYQSEQQAYKQQAMQSYGQMLQYQQQMALSAEEARKAYLMGNKELAQQYDIQRRQIAAGLQAAKMQAETASNEAKRRQMASIFGGIGTVAGAVVGGIYGGPAGAAAGGTVGGAGGSAVGGAMADA